MISALSISDTIKNPNLNILGNHKLQLKVLFRKRSAILSRPQWPDFCLSLTRWRILLPELPQGWPDHFGTRQGRDGHELRMVLWRVHTDWSPWWLPSWVRLCAANHHQTSTRDTGELEWYFYSHFVEIKNGHLCKRSKWFHCMSFEMYSSAFMIQLLTLVTVALSHISSYLFMYDTHTSSMIQLYSATSV